MELYRSVELPDPGSRLPVDLADQATRVVDRTIIKHRRSKGSGDAEQIWATAATSILHILTAPELLSKHRDSESLHRSVAKQVQVAIDFAQRGYQLAAREPMGSVCFKAIANRLWAEADDIENDWLETRLHTSSSPEFPRDSSSGEASSVQEPIMLDDRFKPRHPKTPDTPMARHIEAFKQRIEAEGGREVREIDMVRYYRHSDLRGFQKVQAEDPTASKAVRRHVKEMLQCPSAEKFWRCSDLNSKTLDNLRKA